MSEALRLLSAAMMEKGLSVRGGQTPVQAYWRMLLHKIKVCCTICHLFYLQGPGLLRTLDHEGFTVA
jgi:hypothetical protein